jgi:uncharacterized protein YbgA (DUF1722 family)/uncharacterized protein YbbK (DUF523 family)
MNAAPAFEFPKPRLFISRCLGFAACRYNGITINDEFTARLAPLAEVVTACPEMEIGLGCPREPVRLVMDLGHPRLYQPASGVDHTAAMLSFCQRFTAGCGALDGLLFKSRSPSCGSCDVKLYPKKESESATRKGVGLFAAAARAAWPGLPVEDEGRLRNYSIRDHFLISVFSLADLRRSLARGAFGALLEFHTRNKLLFMAYSSVSLRRLGALVAEHKRRPLAGLVADYSRELMVLLSKPFRYKAMINALQHAFGGFSDLLIHDEKKYFLDTLEEYRDERIPLSVPIRLLKGWAIRHGNGYLLGQSLLEPYPAGLQLISDSGKGRSI